MKRFGLIFGPLAFIMIFLFGCATMESQFRMAKQKDNIEAYEKFVKRYPNSPFTDEARGRLELLKDEETFKKVETRNTITAYRDFIQKYPNSRFIEVAQKRIEESDKEAFVRTWGIGKIQAFQGFIESYPQSKYVTIATDRIEFLSAVKSGTLAAYRKFIKEYPNNLFLLEATASFPILWLGKSEGKVGVVINIEEFVRWKGIFGGGYETEQEVREKVLRRLKKNLEKEGIDAVPLAISEDPSIKGISTILIITYTEKEAPPEQKNIKQEYPGLDGYMAAVLMESTKESFLNSLSGPQLNVRSTISVIDAKNRFDYYSPIPDLYYKTDNLGILQVLAGSKDRMDGKQFELLTIRLISALQDQDWIVRARAAELLGKIKDTSAVEPLIAVLRDKDSDVRARAAEALGEIKDKTAVEPLFSVLRDEQRELVREAIVTALGKMEDKRVIGPLSEVAENDPSYFVRKAAKEALDNIQSVKK